MRPRVVFAASVSLRAVPAWLGWTRLAIGVAQVTAIGSLASLVFLLWTAIAGMTLAHTATRAGTSAHHRDSPTSLTATQLATRPANGPPPTHAGTRKTIMTRPNRTQKAEEPTPDSSACWELELGDAPNPRPRLAYARTKRNC